MSLACGAARPLARDALSCGHVPSFLLSQTFSTVFCRGSRMTLSHRNLASCLESPWLAGASLPALQLLFFHLFLTQLWRVSSVLENRKINLCPRSLKTWCVSLLFAPETGPHLPVPLPCPTLYCLLCSLTCPPVIATEVGQPCDATPNTGGCGWSG